MNLGPLRAQALALNLAAHGVDVTVTLAPDGDPIEARGLWMTPLTEAVPTGSPFSRHQAIRIMAIAKSAVPSIPVGSLVDAPEYGSDAATRWRVDGVDREEADHTRVVLVPDPVVT